MKNKIIIPAVVAVFAISGISTVGYGHQAHALTPEQEEATHMATINGYLNILEKKIAQAPDLETANKYVAEYESGIQYSLAGLSAPNQITVRNSIEILKQKINNLRANNVAQAAKSSNDNLRQEVRNEIAALKNSIQNTNNRIDQEKAGILKYVDQEKAGVLKYIEANRAEVEAQIKEAKTQFTAKINNLENKIAELEAKNDSQDDEIKALKAELVSLRNSVSELDSKLESLKTELDGKINNLESELGNLKADFEDLDAEVENIWESISEIWAEIDELLKKIKTESLEAEKRANEYTNSKIAELASRIENNLNERFGKVDKQIAKLNFKGLAAPNTGVERQNPNALLALNYIILTLISSAVVIRKKL